MRDLPVRHTGTIHVQMLVKKGLKGLWEELALPPSLGGGEIAAAAPRAAAAAAANGGGHGGGAAKRRRRRLVGRPAWEAWEAWEGACLHRRARRPGSSGCRREVAAWECGGHGECLRHEAHHPALPAAAAAAAAAAARRRSG